MEYSGFSQSTKKTEPWSMGFGMSKGCGELYYYNIRLISPRFKFETTDDYWTAEEEKQPAKFKKSKFLFELLIPQNMPETVYKPECILSCNVSHRFFKAKFIDLTGIVGLSYGINTITMRQGYGPPSNEKIRLTFGSRIEFDFRYVIPYMEISAAGYNGYITGGMEFRLRKIYRKLNRRYDLDV